MSKWTRVRVPKLTDDLRREVAIEALSFFDVGASITVQCQHITQHQSFVDVASEREAEHSLLGE